MIFFFMILFTLFFGFAYFTIFVKFFFISFLVFLYILSQTTIKTEALSVTGWLSGMEK